MSECGGPLPAQPARPCFDGVVKTLLLGILRVADGGTPQGEGAPARQVGVAQGKCSTLAKENRVPDVDAGRLRGGERVFDLLEAPLHLAGVERIRGI